MQDLKKEDHHDDYFNWYYWISINFMGHLQFVRQIDEQVKEGDPSHAYL